MAEYEDVRAHAQTLADVTFIVPSPPVTIDGAERRVELVEGRYFEVLGVPMALGRAFTPGEDRLESPSPVVVLSHPFWRTHVGGDPDVIGRTLRIEDVPFTVVGVANPSFTGGTFPVDLWMPAASRGLVHQGSALGMDGPCCRLVARLARSATRGRAQAELSLFADRHRREGPLELTTRDVRLVGTRLIDQPGAGRAMLAPFAALQTVVGAIFLLACANVANLVLSRAMARDRELAVRLAVGAGRWHIVRQLLIEALLLAAVASVVVLLMAAGFDWTLARLRPDSYVSVPIDLRVLAYSTGIALLATLLCGLAPGLQATRTTLLDALKRQSPQATPRLPLRGVLLGMQVAISVTVLVCAGLLVRGMERAAHADLGFRLEGLSAITVSMNMQEYDARGPGALVARLRDELRLLGPVGVTSRAPLSYGVQPTVTAVLAAVEGVAESRALVEEHWVDAGFFDVLGIPLVAGRHFAPGDRDVVLVNETMARRHWPGDSAVGQTIRLPVVEPPTFPLEWVWDAAVGRLVSRAGPQERVHEIVGVIRDAQLTWPNPVGATIFRMHGEADQRFTLLVPHGGAAGAVQAVTRAETGARPTVAALTERFHAQVAGARGLAATASVFGVLALVLAATGVYGVVAYSVEGRRREIGIRMALGARMRGVVAAIVGSHARALTWGLAVGLALSLVASSVLESSLYGLHRLDPVAYGGVLLLLWAVGVAAAVLPVRRASRINPVEVLRAD